MIRRRRRAGFVLLAVLWVMVGVSAMGLGLALVARQAIGSARNRRGLTVARWAADDCLGRAEAMIAPALDDRGAGVTRVAGSHTATWATLDRLVPGAPLVTAADCTAVLRPCGTTIDVNTADTELLTRLFHALGDAPTRADSLSDAILDWRDPDQDPRPNGAESAWYRGRHRAPPRDAPFANVQELVRVRGLDQMTGLDSLLGVEPDRIVLDRAPLPVIAALPGFSAEAVARVAEHRARGAPITDVLSFSAELSPDARAALLARYPDLIRLTTTEPDAWLLTARSTAGVPAVTAVVELRLVRAGVRAAIVRRRTWVE